MEDSNPTCSPGTDPLPTEAAVSESGDPATEEVASVSGDDTPMIALESSLPDAELCQPDAGLSPPEAEPNQLEPVDDLEVIQCLRCTALLPCYARYCLHCGALQEASQVADESAPPASVPDETPLEVIPVGDEAPVLQVLPEDPLPEPVSTPEPTFMDLLRAEQQRVEEKLVPLESDRYWWKKYF